MPERTLEQSESALANLRAEIARIRQELTRTTQQYRCAVAQHDSEQAIPLLRSRSRLMRRLLDTQCELLLSFRSEERAPLPERQPDSSMAVAS